MPYNFLNKISVDSLPGWNPPPLNTWWNPMVGTFGVNTPTLNSLFLHQFLCPKFTFQSISVEITTAATAGGVIRCGIYGGQPGSPADLSQLSLLADFGSFASTALGAIVMPSSLAAPGGTLWFASVTQVATCAVRAQTTGMGLPMAFATTAETPGTNGQRMGLALAGVTGALPTTGALTVNNNPPPKFFIRRSVT